MFIKKTGIAAFIASSLMAASMGAAQADTVQVNVTGEIVATTCTLDQKADGIAVDLGKVTPNDFVGGVGAAASSKDFSLDFHDCAVESAQVTANGNADAADANGYANTGTATNVAVELKSADKYMDSKGVTVMPVTFTDGAGSLPLTASMVQSNATLPTVGTVASVVTLNVAYQ